MAKHITSRRSLVILFLLIPTLLWAAPPSRIYTYNSGEVIDPAKVTSNEDAIFNYLTRGVDTFSAGITTDNILDGTLTNSDISGTAAIAYSKLNLTGAVLNADLAGSIANTKLSPITSASLVSGSAITGLANIPSGAGLVPTANLGTGTASASNYLRGDQTWASAGNIGKVTTLTRDLSAVTGDVSYTGLGFKPTSIIAFAYINTGTTLSLGFSDATTEAQVVDASYSSAGTYSGGADNVIVAQPTAGAYQTADVKTFDADGFTLTWTKTGSPTGTLTVYVIALR